LLERAYEIASYIQKEFVLDNQYLFLLPIENLYLLKFSISSSLETYEISFYFSLKGKQMYQISNYRKQIWLYHENNVNVTIVNIRVRLLYKII